MSAQLVHIIHHSPLEAGQQRLLVDNNQMVEEEDFIGAGSLTAQQPLPIALAPQGQVGVLKSELQKAFLIDTNDTDQYLTILLNVTRLLQITLALNIQYEAIINNQGENMFPKI